MGSQSTDGSVVGSQSTDRPLWAPNQLTDPWWAPNQLTDQWWAPNQLTDRCGLPINWQTVVGSQSTDRPVVGSQSTVRPVVGSKICLSDWVKVFQHLQFKLGGIHVYFLWFYWLPAISLSLNSGFLLLLALQQSRVTLTSSAGLTDPYAISTCFHIYIFSVDIFDKNLLLRLLFFIP